MSRSNYTTQMGTVLDDCENSGSWIMNAGSLAEDQTYYKTGTKGLSLTATNGGAFTTRAISSIVTPSFGFWVYASDTTTFSSMKVTLSSAANFSKYFERRISVDDLKDGWNFVSLGIDDWTNVGGESWSNKMVWLRFRVDSYANKTASITIDSVYYGIKSRPKVIVEFDDGWVSAYTNAFPIMQEKNIKGTMGVIAARINVSGFLSDAQANEMYDAGWDMITHGDFDMTTLASQAAMVTDIQNNRAYMTSKGLTRNNCHMHYTYPLGRFNNTVLAAMKQAGMYTARTIISEGISTARGVDNFHLLRAHELRSDTTTLAMAKGYIDTCIARGETLILFGHLIVANPTNYLEWSTSDFQELIDYLHTKVQAGEIDVVTRSEWFDGLLTKRQPIS